MDVVIRCSATKGGRRAAQGADEIFLELQQDGSTGIEGLRETPHLATGITFSMPYTIIYGLPYEYIITIDTETYYAIWSGKQEERLRYQPQVAQRATCRWIL